MSTNNIPLNPMQKAYLLGKSKLFPLSQSSMHDFREFRGQIDTEQLNNSLSRLVQKYSALRTVIDEHLLVQKIEEQLDLSSQFKVYDFQTLSDQDAQQKLQAVREQFSHYLHRLDTPPWFICLVQLPKQFEYSSIVLTSFDGLILDGYSISVLLDELFDFNDDQIKTEKEKAPVLDKSFFHASEKDRQFWHDKLDTFNNVTQLPWKTALEKITDPHYQRRSIVIQKAQLDKISLLSAKQKLFPNSFITTILLDVLSLWTEDQSLLISMPISNSSMTKVVGNNSSFIVLDYQFDAEKSFIDQAKQNQKNILQSMTHTTYSGIEISKYLIKRMQESIVLPVALTNGLSWKKPPKNKHIEYVGGLTQTPQLALDIRLSLSADLDLVIDLDYVEEALSEKMIQDILQAFQTRLNNTAMLESISDCSLQQSAVSPISDTTVFEDTFKDSVVDDYLTHIQQNLFNNIPDKTALIFDGQTISYAEFGENVAKVRVALDQAGIGQNQVVAICLRKSPEHIYAILACALSGVIWLPVDMDSPKVRQDYILKNSCAEIAISTIPMDGLPNINIHDALNSLMNKTTQNNLFWQHRHDASPAYYLYTSGSTGTPKCVVLNNRATANVMQETIAFWNIQYSDIHLAATPFHHDMAIFDIMAPLSVGGTLVVPTLEEAKSAVAWSSLIEKYQVTIWCTVPAMADMLLTAAEASQLQSIKLINQGGDYVKPSVIQKFREILPNTRLISIGGPTETTIWSIWHEITQDDQDLIPYGKDIKHNKYYILNTHGAFCPAGVVGQLYMTGINLANGYLLDGQINQKDFVWLTLPNGEQHRAFRMSDKGYLREDGNIIFAGRDEGYLKVRGVRIAASEIENALLKHPQITDCVVTTCINPIYEGNELVAIYTASQKNFRPTVLRQFLQEYVPSSHIPSRWVPLEAFPITRNGKIDRQSLKQTAQKILYATYAHITPEQSQTKSLSLENDVIHHLRSSLKQQSMATALFMETEILAVGITPGHLNHLAKHFSQQLKTSIDFLDLAKCKTIGEIVKNIQIQINRK